MLANVVTLWAANGDKAELQRLGSDFDDVIWRSFDIQPSCSPYQVELSS
jgi:hypothetical protein